MLKIAFMYSIEAMWCLVALLCVVVIAQEPNDRDHWDQVSPVNGEQYIPGAEVPQPTPIRPRWEKSFGRPVLPDPVSTLYPDGLERHAQEPSKGSPFGQDPVFPGQNGGDGRWGGVRKPQRNGRTGRPSDKLQRMQMLPTQAPVDGGKENQMSPLFGKPLSPNMMDNRQFVPIFKAENVTLQNINAFHLKEGENVFLLPKGKGQMQPPKKGGVNRPQELGYGQGFSLYGPQPYVKLIYNPAATQKISFEYGITQLLPAFMKAESKSDPRTM